VHPGTAAPTCVRLRSSPRPVGVVLYGAPGVGTMPFERVCTSAYGQSGAVRRHDSVSPLVPFRNKIRGSSAAASRRVHVELVVGRRSLRDLIVVARAPLDTGRIAPSLSDRRRNGTTKLRVDLHLRAPVRCSAAAPCGGVERERARSSFRMRDAAEKAMRKTIVYARTTPARHPSGRSRSR